VDVLEEKRGEDEELVCLQCGARRTLAVYEEVLATS